MKYHLTVKPTSLKDNVEPAHDKLVQGSSDACMLSISPKVKV